MNRTAALTLLAALLLTSCHDSQKADSNALLATAAVLANRISELESEVDSLKTTADELQARMDKIDRGGQ